DELALGMLATALVGLAAQLSPGSGARFYALDGSPADAGYAGTLGRVAAALPHGVRVGGVRDVGPIVGEVAAEVERRQAAPDAEAGPAGAARVRDAGGVPDECGRLEQPDRHAAGGQAGAAPGAVPQRGAGPAGEVPAVRAARGGVGRGGARPAGGAGRRARR